MKPADRSRFEFVDDLVCSANFTGASIPAVPGTGPDLRNLLPPFTHLELIPIGTPVPCTWVVSSASGPGARPLNPVIQQGTPAAVPTDTVIQRVPQGASLLSLDTNPPSVGAGTDAYFVLVRAYRERADQ